MAVLLCPRDFADLCGVTVAEESLRAAREPCTTATTAHVVLYDEHAFQIAVELQDICWLETGFAVKGHLWLSAPWAFAEDGIRKAMFRRKEKTSPVHILLNKTLLRST